MRSLLRMAVGGVSNCSSSGRGASPIIIPAALTYVLGNSLYVPLTSHCNSRTLPQTRGPGFELSGDVTSALLSVRALEDRSSIDNVDPSSKDIAEPASRNVSKLLPVLPKVGSLFPLPHQDESDDNATNSTTLLWGDKNDYTDADDGRLPTPTSLIEEISKKLQTNSDINSLVIAGEGEPTLRLSSLLRLAQSLSSMNNDDDDGYDGGDDTTTSIMNRHEQRPRLPLRVVTNGLGSAVPGNPTDTAFRLRRAGVTHVSVALMTADPSQYDVLMDIKNDDDILVVSPCATAHESVCHFITDALKCGLGVEVTGVESPDVDKEAMEKLATEQLGVKEKVRWRPFFP